MDRINKIFIKRVQGKRPVNMNFEQAREFAEYVGLNTVLVMKLFSKYGRDNVLKLRSDLKDFPFKDKIGYAINKLKKS